MQLVVNNRSLINRKKFLYKKEKIKSDDFVTLLFSKWVKENFLGRFSRSFDYFERH